MRLSAPLRDLGQDVVVAAFQAQVNPFQARGRQDLKLIQALAQDVLGRAVDRDAFQSGKQGSGEAADFRQGRGGHGDGVAGGQKDGPYRAAVSPAGLFQVCLDLPGGPDLELHPLLIDQAEGAEVVGAAHGGLDQQAVGLAGRTVDGAFVMHNQ